MSLERCKQFFQEADKDNSGKLTYAELEAKLKSKGYADDDNSFKKLFDAGDVSGDGQISLQEYLEVMGQVPPKDHGGALMRQCFRQFDKNRDGSIDHAELKQVFAELGKSFSDAELKRMIELVDKDASGTLDYNEFIKQVFGKDS